MAGWALCGASLAAAGDGCTTSWPARLDALTTLDGAGICFTVSQDGPRITARLDYQGRTFTAALPGPLGLPLDGQVRLRDPWATFAALRRHRPLANLGWNLWDGRPVPVRAAAAGVVLSHRVDPVHGTLVEIDHGSGLRTRYALNRYGTSAVAPGTQVAAGDPIGALGAGLPDDIPYVHFGVLFDPGAGPLLALDPAPFFFATAANRALPFATSVLNAAVRAGDTDRIMRLLKLGLDPNGRSVDGTLPLEWAILGRDAGMVRLLVAAGADRNAKTAEGIGRVVEGLGLTIANTGPTLVEAAQETEDPDLMAALAAP